MRGNKRFTVRCVDIAGADSATEVMNVPTRIRLARALAVRLAGPM
jgi:hypothetical protein